MEPLPIGTEPALGSFGMGADDSVGPLGLRLIGRIVPPLTRPEETSVSEPGPAMT